MLDETRPENHRQGLRLATGGNTLNELFIFAIRIEQIILSSKGMMHPLVARRSSNTLHLVAEPCVQFVAISVQYSNRLQNLRTQYAMLRALIFQMTSAGD